MRIFTASLATETNTFSPVPTDRARSRWRFYAPPGKHPETPTLCSSPMRGAAPARGEGRADRDRGHRRLGRARRPGAAADL